MPSEEILPLNGYIHAMDQPAIRIKLIWDLPADLRQDPAQALANLDAWLLDALAMQYGPRERAGSLSPRDALRAGAWRILELAAELQRIVGVPVFHSGMVLGIREDGTADQRSLIQAAVVAHDLISHEVLQRSYQLSMQLIGPMMATRPTPQGIEAMQRTIQERHIDVLAGRIPSAKSTLPLLRTAYRRAIPFQHLGRGCYQLGWGSRQHLMQGSALELDSSIGSALVRNKYLCAQLLRRAGLPAAVHRPARSEEAALAAAHALGWPVVVKPVDRDRGEGVTIGIDDPELLRQAWEKARSFSESILVERQAAGVCHRVHVTAERVIGVVQRLPKSVRGDGVHTVAELIAGKNAERERLPPWSRLVVFPSDSMAEECLARECLRLDTVPAPGQLAPLRPFSSIEWGGVVENFTDTIHPDNIEASVRAARLFGLTTAGIDMISTDITRSWHETGAIINEVNFAPQIGGSVDFTFMLEATFDTLFQEQGRIPVQVFVGGNQAWIRARERQGLLVDQGCRCVLTSHAQTFSPQGRAIVLAADGLFERCRAMLCRSDTDALVVVVQTSEWLMKGLPFDRPSEVVDAGDPLLDAGPMDPRQAKGRLLSLLQAGPQVEQVAM